MRKIRFRCWNKNSKTMTPSFPIWKCGGDPTGAYLFLQYIGLKDKNGKEIYEGDIVNCNGMIRVVQYNEKQAAFKYYLLKYNHSFDMLKSEMLHDEIIGNIYENPELMDN